jgi:hypothetical protein
MKQAKDCSPPNSKASAGYKLPQHINHTRKAGPTSVPYVIEEAKCEAGSNIHEERTDVRLEDKLVMVLQRREARKSMGL